MGAKMGDRIGKIKPAVEKSVLLYLAAALWIFAGSMLLGFAAAWLRHLDFGALLVRAAAGIAAALIIHHFGFLRVVDKNLARILPMDGKRCLFSFMNWKSYFLVAVMALMGAVLRYSPIPKHLLAVPYAAIGVALLLSSIRYLRVVRCSLPKGP